jgi:hypothetical protein
MPQLKHIFMAEDRPRCFFTCIPVSASNGCAKHVFDAGAKNLSPAAAVPRHSSGFGKRMFTPLCAAVCFASELPARICCNAGIVPIFFNFFPAETRLNRPDSHLNQDGSHLNCPDSHLNRGNSRVNRSDSN